MLEQWQLLTLQPPPVFALIQLVSCTILPTMGVGGGKLPEIETIMRLQHPPLPMQNHLPLTISIEKAEINAKNKSYLYFKCPFFYNFILNY